MDPIKGAFDKVKQEIKILNQEIGFLKYELHQSRQAIIEICEIIKQIKEKYTSTHIQEKPTTQEKSPTEKNLFKPQKAQNMLISIGNQGVPTDRQTNQQTDRQTQNPFENKSQFPVNSENKEKSPIDEAAEFLDSLDNIKKEIRLKFKRLTEKELGVFSTLYQIISEKGHSDYRELAERLNLTESSIRDYIGKLIKKEIPVEKIRLNNKNIQLKISENLMKIASLSTILHLVGI